MRIKSIALLGISGVGKSTFLKVLSHKISFRHAQASSLIKDQLALETSEGATSEELRVGNTDDNQRLLISAFRRMAAESEDRIILDAHAIIDKGTHIDKVEIDVFVRMGFDILIVLVAAPDVIARQRSHDCERIRPQLSADEIMEHQNLSNEHAIRIAGKMGIPCVIVSYEQVDFLATVLT